MKKTMYIQHLIKYEVFKNIHHSQMDLDREERERKREREREKETERDE